MISWTTLDQVVVPITARSPIQQGWSPQCDSDPAGPEEWGVLKTTAIQPGRFDETANKRLPTTLEPKPALEVRPGDVLLTCAGPRSRCGIPALVRSSRERLMISGKIYRLRTEPSVLDPRFLEFYLLSPMGQSHIDGMKTGISDNGLNLTKQRFLSLPVPVAPLSEQRRIVEIVEDHLSHLDAGQAALSLAARRAERLLMATAWHATHSQIAGRVVRLDEIADVRLGRQRSPKNHSGDRMRPYLRAANVDWDSLRLGDIKEMNFTAAEEATYRLQPGDILLTEASGSASEVGKSAIYEGHPTDVCFQNTLLRVRCHSADPRFVQKYLLAEAMTGRFLPESRGVGINHLGRARLASVEIALPSAEAQADAIAQFEAGAVAVQRLRLEIARQAKRAESLRRVLLAAAFSGRLTGASSDTEAIEETEARLAKKASRDVVQRELEGSLW